MHCIKETITDIITPEGKTAYETEITQFDVELPEDFRKIAELNVPKCGRINFKHQIMPHLLPKGAKLPKDATAKIAIATDGNGNICLRCVEVENATNLNAWG